MDDKLEMFKKGDWLRDLSDDALQKLYCYYERNFGTPRRDIYRFCTHCGEAQVVEAHGYQIDACDVSVYYDEDDEQAWRDWDDVYIEADFDYVCSRCGTSFKVNSLDELGEEEKNKNE